MTVARHLCDVRNTHLGLIAKPGLCADETETDLETEGIIIAVLLLNEGMGYCHLPGLREI